MPVRVSYILALCYRYVSSWKKGKGDYRGRFDFLHFCSLLKKKIYYNVDIFLFWLDTAHAPSRVHGWRDCLQKGQGGQRLSGNYRKKAAPGKTFDAGSDQDKEAEARI